MTRSMLLVALWCAAALAPAAARAEPLTIMAGESWIFELDHGEPARARRVHRSARPAAGQIKASVIAMMGTTMTLTNNSPTAYTLRAELVGAPPGAPARVRSCTLPANRDPALEYWPVKAAGVRLSHFRPAIADGNCP